jgi:hypothetical protein
LVDAKAVLHWEHLIAKTEQYSKYHCRRSCSKKRLIAMSMTWSWTLGLMVMGECVVRRNRKPGDYGWVLELRVVKESPCTKGSHHAKRLRRPSPI